MAEFNHEREVDGSLPAGGYFEDIPYPLLSFRSGVTALGAATDPTAVATNDQHVIVWGAADTDAILGQISLPGQWAKDDGRFRVRLGVVLDTSGGANADVDLLCTARVKNPDGTLAAAANPTSIWVNGTLMSTPANGARLPEGTDASDEAEVIYEFDLSAYDPHATVTFKVVPDQAPGAGNTLEIHTALMRPRRHASLRDRAARS